MSNSTASSTSRTTPSDRFYSPPAFRKHQQRRFDSHSVEPDFRTGSYKPALPSTSALSNLDRLLDALSPSFPPQSSFEPRMKGRRADEFCISTSTNIGSSCYVLEDLWETYREWSAYGVEVPVSQDGEEDAKMYYVPSLSAIQLYAVSRLGEDSDAELSNETSNSPGKLVYEYLERAQPHIRPPLHDKASPVSILASEFPSLKKYRSCDISPSSWFSVAWYPIYKIPVVSSVRRVDASFLTFHSLTPHPRRKNQSQLHPSSGRKVHGDQGSLNISLPAFALASYKLRGSMLAPSTDSEWQKVDSLLQAATDWLQSLQVKHPDYLYFVSRSP
ncbi:hypothetical protein VNO78_20709 [Psophocarpus tetragonolobus]|uniref:Uncharacterized protein n=1 Tax=Psophocarpus tetragonolobus TaxID=3891 RepID=A0AAN9SAF2_PSOTE